MDVPVAALRAASKAMRVTPMPVVNIAGRGVAAAIARFSPQERRIVERNLQRTGAWPDDPHERRRAVRRVFDSYGRYWVDALRLADLSEQDVAAGFSIEGYEHIDAAEAAGRAPILALPHMGGWEWAARWLATEKKRKVAAVVEEIEPPELYRWFLELREQLGMHVIPLSEGTAGVAKALAAREIVCLLCDRDISGHGVEVEFFGERTTLPGGPALMALRSGSPLLPTAAYFRNGRSHGIVEPPLDTARRGRLREDVTRVTQDLARVLEMQIRRAPEQWHLLQPNWPSDHVALGSVGAGSVPRGSGTAGSGGPRR